MGWQDAPAVAAAAPGKKPAWMAAPAVEGVTQQVAAPHTTAGGVMGSLTRGVAPYAAGAAIGGALGGPPGAAVGGGAVVLTQLATSLYDAIADRMGWSKAVTPEEATQKVLDLAGVAKPSTATERTLQTMAGGAAGGFAGGAAAGAVARSLLPGVGKEVAKRMAEGPGVQAASGALGGASAQTAAEHGAGPLVQTGASFLGSLVPYTPAMLRGAAAITPSQAAKTAIDSGYSLHPAEATEGSIGGANLANVLAGFAGKVKTRQYASALNQPVTNGLAAEDLGLPRDTALTPQTYESVRRNAGAAYAALKAVPRITVDFDYFNEAMNLEQQARMAAAEFPDFIDMSGVEKIRSQLLAKTDMSTSATVDAIKRLRFDAKANLQARADPDKLVLGLAQRQAATIMEDLIERQLASTRPDLVPAYRAARTLIAKSYDYETATNVSTNDVDARYIGALYDKGKPFTGNAKVIADAANHFPHSFQPAAKLGGVEGVSVLDLAYAAAAASTAAIHGNYGLAGALGASVPFTRMGARATVMSRPFQNAMVNDKPSAVPLPMLWQPGEQAVTPPGPPAKPKEGMHFRDASGREVQYRDGKWVDVH